MERLSVKKYCRIFPAIFLYVFTGCFFSHDSMLAREIFSRTNFIFQMESFHAVVLCYVMRQLVEDQTSVCRNLQIFELVSISWKFPIGLATK